MYPVCRAELFRPRRPEPEVLLLGESKAQNVVTGVCCLMPYTVGCKRGTFCSFVRRARKGGNSHRLTSLYGCPYVLCWHNHFGIWYGSYRFFETSTDYRWEVHRYRAFF